MIAPQSTDAPRPDPRIWNVRRAKGREDAFYLVRLWHHYFGTEYESNWLPYGPYQVAEWADDDEDVRDAYGVIATHDKGDCSVSIGGGLVELYDHEQMVEELPDGRFEKEALAGSRNAMLLFGIVDPAWRGHGIGHQLFRDRLEWAIAQGADMAFAWGWERREGRTSRPLFEEYDFVPVQKFPAHYEETRDACPDCGVWQSDDESCRCEATLWARDLPIDRLTTEK